ncbi:MAG: DUF1523 family protein [Pelagimonas sp.]|jgi:hypothetical protein|nr:DUF1523 family protein [Pelagimonas sp.]
MKYVKWTILALVWLIVAAFLHYTLPQYDIARITDTYEKRVDPGSNSIFWAQADTGSNAAVTNRDVFFIQTMRANGKPMVYRNEDTGWGWPPYFKIRTSNVQAEAADLKSTAEDPKWVAIKHYGWRSTWLSINPNVLSIKAVDGPDVRVIPWGAIVILILLAALFWALRVRWIRFREARIDPVVDQVEDSIEDGSDRIRGWFGRK